MLQILIPIAIFMIFIKRHIDAQVWIKIIYFGAVPAFEDEFVALAAENQHGVFFQLRTNNGVVIGACVIPGNCPGIGAFIVNPIVRIYVELPFGNGTVGQGLVIAAFDEVFLPRA